MNFIPRFCRLPLTALLAATTWSTALAFPVGHDLYIQPAGTGFIEKSGETVVSVNVSSGLISDAQSQLNSAHSSNPGAVVVLTLSGTYTVTNTPLQLSSHTCLVLATGCVIQASGSATATSLVEVSSQTNVSIAGGTLDGAGRSLNAIHVITSNRVHIDKVVVRNCGTDGIALTGHGNTTFDNELMVTRSEVSGCTGNGISASSGTQTVCSDNYCHDNGAAGIYLATAHSTAVNNRCVSNAEGIVAHGSASAVTDNTVDANATGIALDSSSNANLCTSNVITNSTTVAMSDAGTNDIIFENSLTGNAANLTATGTGADVFAWRGSLSASGQNYFYPPLIDNQHTSAIENGKARTDVTIGSGTLANVQTQYNNARSAHPNDVIVLHLTGSSYTGSSSVTLSSDTCILLSGTINLSSGVKAFVATGQSRICISGGIIDGGGSTTAMAVSLSTGCGMVQLDSLTIRNFGPLTPRSSGGVVENTKGATPFIVSRCTLNGGSARGLWVVNGPFTVICTDTTTSNFNMDGIDLDSHTVGSLVKFCTCTGNFRCGIFVEQSAYYNQLIGNVLTGNYRSGVSVWNNGLSGNESPGTNWNSVICNSVSSNTTAQSSSGYGIETGCQPGGTFQQYTGHNLFFNNDVTDNQGVGLEDGNLDQGPNASTQSIENFFCQNIVMNNGTDYVLSSDGGEKFFNPRVPALSVAAPTFSPAAGTYPSAQSVTIGTMTGGATIRYTTDGSTPTKTTGTVYSAPITVSTSETLKAIAYETGYADSSVASAAYTITAGGTTITSASGFYDNAMPAAQTRTFETTWNASTSLSPSNSLVGLAQGAQTAYTGIAVAVRFNSSGNIDALNGTTGVYSAVNTIPFAANTTYHFRVVVNVPAQTFSAYVTAPGGSEVTIATNYGYRSTTTTYTQLDTWVADVNATPGGSMTMSNFAITPATFTVDASAGSNGSISPSGAVTVNSGASQAFTITPNSGYAVSSVIVDGTNVGAVTTYTFSNVQANHTISAAFAANPTFTITASAGSGGTISPSGGVTVNQGANQTFTIAANSGNTISDVAVDGASVGAVSSYTFTNVQANHTISASFSGSTPTEINDTDAGITYTGTWSYSSNRTHGEYQADVHFTSTNGDSVSYTFNGTGISYITETYTDEGNVSFYIDNVFQQTVSCVSSTRIAQVAVFTASGLSSGTHTLKAVKVDGTYMLIDALIYTTSGSSPVAAPTFSPGTGTYTSAQSVTISSTTTGASIRYTTDGSTPTETNGTLYSGPVVISSNTTLQAIAYKSGMIDSTVSSATYSFSVTVTVATGFYNQALTTTKTGTFTATFDASPSLSPSNALIGLSQGAAAAYTDIAVSVRFNPSGNIDARNGGAFSAATTIPFTAGTSYHFRLVINVPAHTYSIYVTPAGGSELTVGTNYAFRTEQIGVTQLDTWNADVNATPGGSLTVSNFVAP